ncbi:MAG TPA: RNA 2',3'-cyclic phosphodiesterase [Gaiellaceae bacterium]|nr:RNA 2',3'-cyclic phosphodiesterase [Gaiellaceae bacterium]
MEGDERLRLFLAVRLPDDVVSKLVAWQERELRPALRGAAGRLVPGANLHLTLAFLGSRPAGELPAIVQALEEACGRAQRPELEVRVYREGRSVGMLVLDDHELRATRLAEDVQAAVERLGAFRKEKRPWLPHVTVVRYRERPRLRPPLPDLGRIAPSDAAAFLSRLHPSGARYEVLESFALC